MLKQAKIIISGHVQGVFFRVWAKRQAEELDLVGFARNDLNRTVLIVAKGEETAIQELVDRCHDGPELARVSEVKVEWGKFSDGFSSFIIT